MINNDVYHTYGDRWYTAFDDPVALLRAENEAKWPWVLQHIQQYHASARTLLDVGCGAGFLTNRMAREGFAVTGIDLSAESLTVAERFDATKSVKYVHADAYQLPFADASFDLVTSMDFLEHVPDPARVVRECARVLRPGGLFFYHTFNRNPIAEAVVIKFVEAFVRNTPPKLHVIDLFIRPEELLEYCAAAGLENLALTGLRPELSTVRLSDIISGIVPESLRFTTTKNLLISYLGVARRS